MKSHTLLAIMGDGLSDAFMHDWNKLDTPNTHRWWRDREEE